ncbi:MAG: hypothetical protein A2046_05220 [Bacteroidetes bacterium GWA2_30_7]|nr:MAG: hypothetical protein A2046_05220 [Bacteroidetes bacterium GWA2_30_7]
MKKEIDKKGKTYFIDKMYIDNKIAENFNLEAEKTMKKENNSINDFPKEDGLKNSNILVVTYAEKDKLHYKNSLKFLNKYYPYKYTLITIDEFHDYLDKGYKYALISKRDFLERIESKNELQGKPTSGFGANDNSYVIDTYKYYYVVKDLETLDMYYGTDKEKLISKENVSPARALKTTLEMMLDFYKWTEKE